MNGRRLVLALVVALAISGIFTFWQASGWHDPPTPLLPKRISA